jgi:hypothetical protein
VEYFNLEKPREVVSKLKCVCMKCKVYVNTHFVIFPFPKPREHFNLNVMKCRDGNMSSQESAGV